MLPPDVPGLYRLHWHSGGCSLASVGCNPGGRRWYAPTNWSGGVPAHDWDIVDRAELIAAPEGFYEDWKPNPATDRLILSSLVDAVRADVTDTTSAAALADWMEEHSLVTPAGKVRRLCPETGDVLVMTAPSPAEQRECIATLKKIANLLGLLGKRIQWVAMTEGTTLSIENRTDLILSLLGDAEPERSERLMAVMERIPAIGETCMETLGQAIQLHDWGAMSAFVRQAVSSARLEYTTPVVHYAPYGPNAIGRYDCDALQTERATSSPGLVTCLECQRRSPGLWPLA